MQHLSTWMRRPVNLLASASAVLGALIVAWTLAGHFSPQPAAATPDVTDLLDEPVALTASAEPLLEEAPELVVYVSGAVQSPDVYALPAEARVKDLVVAAGGLSAEADSEQINLASRLSDGQHVHVPRRGEVEALASAPAGEGVDMIDINAAGAEDLAALPGIGAVTAERIVQHRAENGPFTAVEDLQQVKGIGPALFAKIEALVTVGH